MNHSLYSADRATHRRVIGSAAVAICAVVLLCVSLSVKGSDQASTSATVMRAGLPVATSDGGFAVVR